MRNISDLIEQHLKATLVKQGVVEIQRSELADLFQCVPSQINYVISTRFTLEKGYIVESKRGGGGYIRIRKLDLERHQSIYGNMLQLIGSEVTQAEAEGIIYRLRESQLVTAREAELMNSVIDREVIQLKVPFRDQVRANMIKAMLTVLLQ